MNALSRAIRAGVTGGLRGVAKTLPGIVVSYDSTTETCSVKPAVHQLVPVEYDLDEDHVEELPVLYDVPVAWPRAKGFSLVGELEAGDSVLLVAFDRDVSGWRRSGKASEPDTALAHAWSSAVAIPGLQPDEPCFEAPGDAAALAGRVLAELQTLRNYVAALRLAYNGHVHSVSGSATTGMTLGTVVSEPSTPTSVASAILKLDE
jgi:Phage protein Gp138 N-terminal domain